MRLMLVNGHGDDVTVGGAEQLVALLAHELPARGFEVSLLRAFPGGGSTKEQSVLHRVDWRESELRRIENHLGDFLSRPSRALVRALARERPDIVHTHNLPGIGTGIWEVCRRAGVPVVHTIHDYYLLCPRVSLMRRDGTPCRPSPLLCGARRRRLARWAGAVNHVTGVSRYVLEAHNDLFDKAEHHVIRNHVTLGIKRRLRPPQVPLSTIGYIGSLDPIKGVDVLLAAAPELARLGCSLRIAGEGKLQKSVAAAAALLSNVHYVGVVTGAAKESFFESCDLGVLPSVWAEPGGPTLTMVEWLAAGRPLLITRRGGLGEVVDSYPGSIVIEPTVAGIVAAVRELLDLAGWKCALDHVRPPVEEESVSSWIDEYETIYRSLPATRSRYSQ